MASPTELGYGFLNRAYEFFNQEFFSGQLPGCLITLQRKRGALGYFSPERFAAGEEVTDEIALNPNHFSRGPEDVLSTLLHEQVHLWQKHFGKQSRRAYHDRQWASKMEEVGLIPSATGEPGGMRTGQRMTHYIQPGGPFEIACAKFLSTEDGARLYQDLCGYQDSGSKSAASKTAYTCPECGLNCWAKPGCRFICAGCDVLMVQKLAPEFH